jgi:hypothetical protein
VKQNNLGANVSASLESFFDESLIYVPSLVEKIRQRRSQMMIHSYLYYVMDESVITDGKWQQWADELVVLQEQEKTIGFYDDVFADWDGSTGMHLPRDEWIINRAKWLIKAK